MSARRLPMEVVAVWAMYLLVAVAMFVTYSRIPARELYHVSHSGVEGGASRVLVFSNYSFALVAIAVLAILADRLSAWWAAAGGIVLCAAVFWPGVVDQANLDAKLVNAIAAVGVLIAAALTAVALVRVGLPVRSGRQPGDRSRLVTAAAALLVGLPWLAAELGFFLDGIPLVDRVFRTGAHLPPVAGLPPFPPGVHHGHHHGMDGVLLLLSALLLSRVVPSIQRQWLRFATGLYLALMACYGVGNIANDFWTEQVIKRGWTTWAIPDVLRPKASIAWLVIALGTGVVYAAAARPAQARRR